VSVANSFGSALSSNASADGHSADAAVVCVAARDQPDSSTGTNVTLAASATGAPPPADRWYFNGAALSDNSHYTDGGHDAASFKCPDQRHG